MRNRKKITTIILISILLFISISIILFSCKDNINKKETSDFSINIVVGDETSSSKAFSREFSNTDMLTIKPVILDIDYKTITDNVNENIKNAAGRQVKLKVKAVKYTDIIHKIFDNYGDSEKYKSIALNSTDVKLLGKEGTVIKADPKEIKNSYFIYSVQTEKDSKFIPILYSDLRGPLSFIEKGKVKLSSLQAIYINTIDSRISTNITYINDKDAAKNTDDYFNNTLSQTFNYFDQNNLLGNNTLHQNEFDAPRANLPDITKIPNNGPPSAIAEATVPVKKVKGIKLLDYINYMRSSYVNYKQDMANPNSAANKFDSINDSTKVEIIITYEEVNPNGKVIVKNSKDEGRVIKATLGELIIQSEQVLQTVSFKLIDKSETYQNYIIGEKIIDIKLIPTL